MKKLIQLLAVSAGGGLLLGVGLKLCERRREGNGHVATDEAGRFDLFLTRLEALERRIDALAEGGQVQSGTPHGFHPRASQPANHGSGGSDHGSGGSDHGSRESDHGSREPEIEAQFAAMEARLRRELGLRSEDGMGLVAQGIENRFEDRIGPIEAELASQRASVMELKEYSLRTERSVRKLLDGVDRLVAAQVPLG